MTPPRRYHLIFGPPGSGKSTVAECLVERLNRRGQRARLLPPVFDLLFDHGDRDTANVLRREDEWANNLEALLEVASRGLEEPWEISWVFAANACTPQIRLQYPLHLQRAEPVEWIGWWLHTPVATCRRWSAGAREPWPWRGEVIAELAALLVNPDLHPSLEEGFACLVDLHQAEISAGSDSTVLRRAIDAALNRLDGRCAELAGEREELQLHAYSCPGDFERLMYGLVQAIWKRPHTYGNQWLTPIDGSGFAHADDRDFCRQGGLWPALNGGEENAPPVILAPPPRQTTRNHRGGWHALSDAAIFQAVMGELRRYLHGATIPAQHSRELQDLIDRYGLERVVRPIPIKGKALQDLRALILSRPIEPCFLDGPGDDAASDQHLLINPYGEEIRIRLADGSVLEGERHCYLAMEAGCGQSSENARIRILPVDPRRPRIPLNQPLNRTITDQILDILGIAGLASSAQGRVETANGSDPEPSTGSAEFYPQGP